MDGKIRTSGAMLALFIFLAGAMAHGQAGFKSIRIGTQVWMAENLHTAHFRNGEAIPYAATAESWTLAGKEGKPAWCFYENNERNGKYGRLYNWYAVTDPRGLAPEGWHVASDAEWRVVTDYLGGEDAAGTKMKNKTGWIDKGNGTNESGFSALPGGSRNLRGEFAYGQQAGYWWTTTEQDEELAWYRVIDQSPYYVYRTNYSKANGFSVRCIKD
jgi:uncharacterized protein (TIGR02145 family)